MADTNKSIQQRAKKEMKRKKSYKKVMSIATKIEVLKFLDNGDKVSTLAKRYNVNESTVRSIRDKAKQIRETAANLGAQVKVTKIARKNNNILMMEDLLNVWIQDMIRKKIPFSGATIIYKLLI